MKIVEEIRNEIKAIYREPSGRDLTMLAIIFLVIPSAIGGYQLLRHGSESGYYWIGAGVILAVCRLIPPVFTRIYKVWIYLSVILGYFVSRILLTLIFFLVLTPTGLLMRLVGRDPMERKLDPNAQSYWNRREPQEDTSIERYEKQF